MRVFVLGEGGKVNTTFRCGISRPTVPGLPLPEPYCVRLTRTGYAQVRHCLRSPCPTHMLALVPAGFFWISVWGERARLSPVRLLDTLTHTWRNIELQNRQPKQPWQGRVWDAALYLINMSGTCRQCQEAASASYTSLWSLPRVCCLYMSHTNIYEPTRKMAGLVCIVALLPASLPSHSFSLLCSLPVLAIDVWMRPPQMQRKCKGPRPHPSELLCLWLLCGPRESWPNSAKWQERGKKTHLALMRERNRWTKLQELYFYILFYQMMVSGNKKRKLHLFDNRNLTLNALVEDQFMNGAMTPFWVTFLARMF